MFKEFDVIRAVSTLSEKVIVGSEGTILLIYDAPDLAYEVEFVDEKMNTLDILTVKPSDIKLVEDQ